MMSISNTRLHLLLTLMQSEITGNHACSLQLICLYFPAWCREKHHRNTESLELDTLNLTESMNASRSIYLFLSSYHYLSTNGVAPPTTISKQTTNNPFNY